jgi:preprotein translocase subunit YajC
MSIVLIVGLIVIFYFMLIRPQQKRMRQQMELMNNLRAGDEVLTSAGIYGTITEIEEDTVLLEVSEDVEIRVAKSAIARTFTVREEPAEEPAEEEEGEEPAEEAGEEEKAEAAEEAGEEEEAEAEEEPKASGNTSKGKK